MLYVKIEGKENLLSYHIGDSTNLGSVAHKVTEIQADGDELAKIVYECSNIPTVKKSVVTYYGDMAKFIVRNCF